MEPARYRKAMVVLFDLPAEARQAREVERLGLYSVRVTDPRLASILVKLMDEAADSAGISEDDPGWYVPLWLDVPQDMVDYEGLTNMGYALTQRLPRRTSIITWAVLMSAYELAREEVPAAAP